MTTSPQRVSVAAVIGTGVELSNEDGELWHVTERDCSHVPGALGARCLVFMSDRAFRRVWSYPADWRHLDAVSLMAVSWGR
jgi:hypothetical protein